MKMKSKLSLLGAGAVLGAGLLFAAGWKGDKAYNSVLDLPQTPIVKTAYTGTTPAAQPVDFEKAAAAAVPSVVHIKVTMKGHEVSMQEMPGMGDDGPMG